MASPGSIVIQAVVDSTKAVRDAGKLAIGLGKVDQEAGTLDGSLRDAERAMDRMGGEARDSTTDLGRAETGLHQVGEEADDVAAVLRRSGQEMSDSIRRASQDVEADAGRMGGDLGELGRESGAEFVGNIAEGIGSGQANLQDVVSGTLGGLTNLAATLTGPVGIAAGAAAAGIGLVFAAVQAQAEKAKAAIDTVRGALDSVWDKGKEVQEQAIFDAWIEGAQNTTGKIENTRDVLAMAGVTAEEYMGALAGDPKDLDTVRQKINDQADAIEGAKGQQGGLYDFQRKYLDNMDTVLGDLDEQDKAVGAVRREHDAILDLSKDTKGAIGDWDYSKALKDAKEVRDVTEEATRPRSVYINYQTGKVPTSPGGGSGYPSGPRAAPMAAPVNVTINMQGAFNDPIGNARHIKRLLEQGDLRNGRDRGAPLAVAWG